MIINGSGGNDTINLWLNPDLIANSSILSLTPTVSSTATHYADSVTVLGAIMHRGASGTGAGQLDAIRFSNGNGNQAQAIFDVTVPEPTTIHLLGLSAALLGFARRRHLA